MNKKIIGLILGISMIMLASGCTGGTDTTTAAVTAAKAKIQPSVGDTSYDGTISTSDSMDVIPNISGKVSKIYVEIGQQVKTGDPLFQIDDTDLSLQLKQAEASYASAKANYEKSVGGAMQQSELQLRQAVDKAKNDLNDAQLAYDTAKAAYDTKTDITPLQLTYNNAKDNYDRVKQLYEIGAESKVSLDSAETQMNTAKAQLDSKQNALDTNLNSAESRLKNARTALSTAEQNLNITVNKLNPESAKSAQASMESAQVALEIAQKKVSDAKVSAPTDGVVAMNNIQVGDLVTSQAAAMRLINPDKIEVTIQLTEAMINRVSVGMEAEITSQVAGNAVSGVVSEISPSIDSKTGMFAVKVSADNPDDVLKDGTSVYVRILPENKKTVFLVPEEAVLKKDGKSFVYIVQKEKAVKKNVTLGECTEGYWEITNGLDQSDMVIIQGLDKVKDGSKVNLVDAIVKNK